MIVQRDKLGYTRLRSGGAPFRMEFVAAKKSPAGGTGQSTAAAEENFRSNDPGGGSGQLVVPRHPHGRLTSFKMIVPLVTPHRSPFATCQKGLEAFTFIPLQHALGDFTVLQGYEDPCMALHRVWPREAGVSVLAVALPLRPCRQWTTAVVPDGPKGLNVGIFVHCL